MIVTLVSVSVENDRIDDFIKATEENHMNSIKENGNLRFDVLQNESDPSLFTLSEAYESKEAAAAHKETPHYKKWRETVEPWMKKPRTGVVHRIISPRERELWK